MIERLKGQPVQHHLLADLVYVIALRGRYHQPHFMGNIMEGMMVLVLVREAACPETGGRARKTNNTSTERLITLRGSDPTRTEPHLKPK